MLVPRPTLLKVDLPVIDLIGDCSDVLNLVVSACEKFGFFKVVNRGLSPEVISAVEEEGLRFLNKTSSEKQRVRGLSSFGYGSTTIGFNGDIGEVEYLLLHANNPVAVAQLSENISDDPHNFRCIIPPGPIAFGVNVGDALQAMTDERFVSVRHRALTNPSKSRISMAFFAAPARICSPDRLVTPQNPTLYRSYTWDDYKKAAYSLRLGDT